MAYKITFKKSVAKDLKNIDRSEADRILKKITSDLSKQADKSPELKGQFAGLRKYRIENYRIIYAIIDNSVLILRIKHRKDVYKK
ncbi:MAG: type II toxin-antitoxin system mRNA interferase toxin, RelE/StbE family [Thermodesulfobacteriota bacterium]|nr:type II toxin-antitoxin system mRNA interferase toxin, RelE/StbE family [Thermodesulfobacteriota bacterium]